MTTIEAIAVVTALLPTRSVFATKEVTSHYLSSGRTREPAVTYRVSVLPGLHGTTCQQWDGDSFEQAIEKLRAECTPVVSSGNDE